MGYCVKVVLIPCEKASVFILMASALINRVGHDGDIEGTHCLIS